MGHVVERPELRQLRAMAGQGNAVAQLQSGLTQVPGWLSAYTTTQRNALKPSRGGLVIFNSTTSKAELWTGSAWEAL